MRSGLSLLLLVSAFALAAAVTSELRYGTVRAGDAKQPDPQLSARMAVIVNSLRYVLPHASSTERLAASVDDRNVENALQVISSEAEMLAGHLLRAEPTMRHQGRALAPAEGSRRLVDWFGERA